MIIRNFETVIKPIKKNGMHFQGTICYSLTEPRMGGPVYNLKYYIDKAKQLRRHGGRYCLRQGHGRPHSPLRRLLPVKALKQNVKVPVHLHSHFTSGMGDLALLKAIEAGVDIIDTCLRPGPTEARTRAIEPLVMALRYTNRDTGFDLKQLAKCSEWFEKISPKYRHLLDDRMSTIDIGVLLHQTPGRHVVQPDQSAKRNGCLRQAQRRFQGACPRSAKIWARSPWLPPPAR